MTEPKPARSRLDPAKQQLSAARRLARGFAVQGLYRWLLNGQDPQVLLEEVRDFALQASIERLAESQGPKLVATQSLTPEQLQDRLRELAKAELDRCDLVHLDALLTGCIADAAAIDAVLARHVDRPTRLLSPVEHAVLMIGVYELTHCLDIPYRVAINEAVEVAKVFGGTDGHKYVNGVLDRAAGDLRAVEVAARRASR